MSTPKKAHMKATAGIKFGVKAHATAFHPLPDDNPCYTQIGLIAAEGARIEHLLNQSIANAAGVDQKIAACFTGQMIGPGPRFSALLQLCTERGLPTELLKRIKTISGHAGEMFERRNRAVHDAWLEEVGAGTSHQFLGKPKQKTDFGVKPKTEQELKNDLTEFRKHREEVIDLVSDVWKALQPS